MFFEADVIANPVLPAAVAFAVLSIPSLFGTVRQIRHLFHFFGGGWGPFRCYFELDVTPRAPCNTPVVATKRSDFVVQFLLFARLRSRARALSFTLVCPRERRWPPYLARSSSRPTSPQPLCLSAGRSLLSACVDRCAGGL